MGRDGTTVVPPGYSHGRPHRLSASGEVSLCDVLRYHGSLILTILSTSSHLRELKAFLTDLSGDHSIKTLPLGAYFTLRSNLSMPIIASTVYTPCRKPYCFTEKPLIDTILCSFSRLKIKHSRLIVFIKLKGSKMTSCPMDYPTFSIRLTFPSSTDSEMC